MGELLSEMVSSGLCGREDFRPRVLISISCSCVPIVATHFAKNDSNKAAFAKSSLPLSFQKILAFPAKSLDEVKVRLIFDRYFDAYLYEMTFYF